LKWFHWVAISLLLIGTAVDQASTLAGINLAVELNAFVSSLISVGVWTIFDGIILVSIILPYFYLHQRRYFSTVFFVFASTLGSYRLFTGAMNVSLMVKEYWVL